MSKPPGDSWPHTERSRASGHFIDREGKIWAAEQAHRVKRPPITVLLVSPFEEDHAAVRKILTRPEFRLVCAHSAREAVPILSKKRPPVVIAECNLKGCCWKDVWRAVQQLPQPWPRLIVAAEKPGDLLCAEVLDLGACDVLARPFDPEEVVWCVQAEWLTWTRQKEVEDPREAKAVRAAG